MIRWYLSSLDVSKVIYNQACCSSSLITRAVFASLFLENSSSLLGIKNENVVLKWLFFAFLFSPLTQTQLRSNLRRVLQSNVWWLSLRGQGWRRHHLRQAIFPFISFQEVKKERKEKPSSSVQTARHLVGEYRVKINIQDVFEIDWYSLLFSFFLSDLVGKKN